LLSGLILKRMPEAGSSAVTSPVHRNNFKIQNPPVVCFLRIYVLAASTFRRSAESSGMLLSEKTWN
jgi:hypothetical protein